MADQNDATLTGASETSVQLVQPPPTIPVTEDQRLDAVLTRDDFEERLAKRARDAQLRRDAQALEAITPTEDGDAAPAAQQDAGQEPARDDRGRFAPKDGAQQQAEGAPAQQATQDDPNRLVRVKVNGQEREVPYAELVKNFQIESAARQRMELANRREQELRAYEAQLRQAAAALQQQAPALPNQAPQHTAGMPDPKALAQALVNGAPEEVESAIQTLMQARRSDPPAVTPDAIWRQMEQRLADRDRSWAAQQDLTEFSKTHPDILQDPDALALTAQRVQMAMQAELRGVVPRPDLIQRLTPDQLGIAYREAQQRGLVTKHIAGIFGDAAQAVKQRLGIAHSAGAQAIQSRLDAKRAMPSAPPTASMRAPAPKPAAPKSAAQVVQEERMSRGGARRAYNSL